MSAFTLSEKELFIAQSELQSLNNVNENKFENDVWNFEFNGIQRCATAFGAELCADIGRVHQV